MFNKFELNFIHFIVLERIEKNIKKKFFLNRALKTLDKNEKLFSIYCVQLKCIETEIDDLKKLLDKTGDY